MHDELQRLNEAVENAKASITAARARLDGIMGDVRALPPAYKTNICHIIEHAFDDLLEAERALADAKSERASVRPR